MDTLELTTWLDNLPDSPQAATLAGRMAKVKHRLTWGDAAWHLVCDETCGAGFDPVVPHQTDFRVLRVENPGVTLIVAHVLGHWRWWSREYTSTDFPVFHRGVCDDEWDAMRAAESAAGLPVFPYERLAAQGVS